MKVFSFRPALTLRGRTFKGLRGWAGKPLHPPLTDVPVGAYVLTAAFDIISIAGQDEEWARDFYRAASSYRPSSWRKAASTVMTRNGIATNVCATMTPAVENGRVMPNHWSRYWPTSPRRPRA